ncbi:MAG: hypothetical protein HY721_18315 [Planctomycetes bacterium]|nr:hypothetical protein [Planctomycetota bacterium]
MRAGSRATDLFLAKLDAGGNVEWQRTFGGDGFDRARSVRRTLDGGYVLTGLTSSFAPGGVFLVKTDAEGSLEWQTALGGQPIGEGWSVHETRDRGYVVSGICGEMPTGGAGSPCILKTDGHGNLQWSRTFRCNGRGVGLGVVEAEDGGYAMAGWTEAVFLEEKAYFLKLGTEPRSREFVRGDASGNGAHDVEDAVSMLRVVFRATGLPGLERCLDAADANDDGRVNVLDPIFFLGFLFRSGPEIPTPSRCCDLDPTPDALGCKSQTGC